MGKAGGWCWELRLHSWLAGGTRSSSLLVGWVLAGDVVLPGASMAAH